MQAKFYRRAELRMNSQRMYELFEEFSIQLERRFIKGAYTTEDAIRYTMFDCLKSKMELESSSFNLEYPHPEIPNSRIDMYIPSDNEFPGFIFEFKFDRVIPSQKNINKTQRAGKAFADIFRLSKFIPNQKKIYRYFTYVTDKEMAIYFKNPNDQLSDFFELEVGKSLYIDKEYIENHSNTFVNTVKGLVNPCMVRMCYKKDYNEDKWLRIYDINCLDKEIP